jgi:hypothetical protein
MECSIKERWFISVLLPQKGLLPGNGKEWQRFLPSLDLLGYLRCNIL